MEILLTKFDWDMNGEQVNSTATKLGLYSAPVNEYFPFSFVNRKDFDPNDIIGGGQTKEEMVKYFKKPLEFIDFTYDGDSGEMYKMNFSRISIDGETFDAAVTRYKKSILKRNLNLSITEEEVVSLSEKKITFRNPMGEDDTYRGELTIKEIHDDSYNITLLQVDFFISKNEKM